MEVDVIWFLLSELIHLLFIIHCCLGGKGAGRWRFVVLIIIIIRVGFHVQS